MKEYVVINYQEYSEVEVEELLSTVEEGYVLVPFLYVTQDLYQKVELMASSPRSMLIYIVQDGTERSMWIPKSQIQITDIGIVIPEWLSVHAGITHLQRRSFDWDYMNKWLNQ